MSTRARQADSTAVSARANGILHDPEAPVSQLGAAEPLRPRDDSRISTTAELDWREQEIEQGNFRPAVTLHLGQYGSQGCPEHRESALSRSG